MPLPSVVDATVAIVVYVPELALCNFIITLSGRLATDHVIVRGTPAYKLAVTPFGDETVTVAGVKLRASS